MIERLVIGKPTAHIIEQLYKSRGQTELVTLEFNHSQLPGEIFEQTEKLVIAPEAYTVITVDTIAIHCAVDSDMDVSLDKVWVALPLEKPDHLQRLVDLIDEDWLAHFQLSHLWMSGKLHGEILRTLESGKSPRSKRKPI